MGMITAANRLRMSVRERALIGEGTEFLAVNQAKDGILKFPRCPERLSVQKGLPSSRITDNRLVSFTMSLPCVFRTIFCGIAGRFHPERGFGINRASIDLISDNRVEVKAFVPKNMRWEWCDHAIRLPLFSAIFVKLFWAFDRFLMDSGVILERIGMLPMIVIRLIGGFFRFLNLMTQWFSIGLRPLVRFLKKFLSRLLLIWDRLYFLLRAGLRRMVTVLELCRFLDLFTLADKLDQRWKFFHRCLSGFLRVLVEIRWLFEGINVTIHFGRPVACIVQPQQIRPFWQVLAQIPTSLTTEAENLLNKALELYAKLGESGYLNGELSLDNIGFEFEMSKTHLVLIDHGSLVNCKRSPPGILGPWLREVRRHYEQSYQVYKLRAYAESNPNMKKVVERYIQKTLELIDEWIRRK